MPLMRKLLIMRIIIIITIMMKIIKITIIMNE